MQERTPTGRPRGRTAQGEATRQTILERAAQLASREGLEQLTIGRLARELDMSKSGLFAHFGSKEELQLAAIDAARAIYVREVVEPALAAEKGLPRLWAVCAHWLDYAQREVFAGGCFFATVSGEFKSRSGAIREKVAGYMRQWLDFIAHVAGGAQARGQLRADVDPENLAFEIHALLNGVNWEHQLFGDRNAFARGRALLRERLRALAAPEADASVLDGGGADDGNA